MMRAMVVFLSETGLSAKIAFASLEKVQSECRKEIFSGRLRTGSERLLIGSRRGPGAGLPKTVRSFALPGRRAPSCRHTARTSRAILEWPGGLRREPDQVY